MTTGTCIDLDDAVAGGARYSAIMAKWQHRVNSGAPWADIDQLQTSGNLCAYTPSKPGEYQMVAELLRDGMCQRDVSNTSQGG